MAMIIYSRQAKDDKKNRAFRLAEIARSLLKTGTA